MDTFTYTIFRHSLPICILYSVFYAAVFIAGLLGNMFVLLSIFFNLSLRTTTDYMISSLALADLLIIIFCLPSTFINNLFLQWPLGNVACKLSTWINNITSCSSVFTLIAVTADRYLAICHTMKYTVWDSDMSYYVIGTIWLVSGMLAFPQLFIYREMYFDPSSNVMYTNDELNDTNINNVLKFCSSSMDETYVFIFFNLFLTFIVPFVLIIIMYSLIFHRVSTHRSLAVDAHVRDERTKLRAAHMMLTVIIVFAFCWTPLFSLHAYFIATNPEGFFYEVAVTILRPCFQWLSLLSSSLNPLIYIAYSQKYRRAFHQLLLLPCQTKLGTIRKFTFKKKANSVGKEEDDDEVHQKVEEVVGIQTLTTICDPNDNITQALNVCVAQNIRKTKVENL
uniref:G_PROTEIN_RECEP_F1_2 domain-containing protein n=1 Tax=Strongyloides papillosus TaxID=174720 RepID=A0A0N5BCK1_STREA